MDMVGGILLDLFQDLRRDRVVGLQIAEDLDDSGMLALQLRSRLTRRQAGALVYL